MEFSYEVYAPGDGTSRLHFPSGTYWGEGTANANNVTYASDKDCLIF